MHAPVRPGFWAGRLNRANAMSIYLPVQGGKKAKLRQLSLGLCLGFGLSRFCIPRRGFANPAGARINFLA